MSTLLSKLSKRNFCLGSDAKTFFLGYFNRKTLALWKITSNKLIEKPKTLKQTFFEQFPKMNDAITSKNRYQNEQIVKYNENYQLLIR
jgi:hypothetical protein